MKGGKDQLDARLEALFSVVRKVPERDSRAAAQGRERYLEQIRSLQREISPVAAVSPGGLLRLKGWINTIKSTFQIKERSPMFTTLMTILLTISLLAGGTGVTAYAAQDSLPGEALYPVKSLGEDFHAFITLQNQARLNLMLAYADRRIAEFTALNQAGEAIPAQSAERLQVHIEQAFKYCAQTVEIEPALDQLQTRLRQQEQWMTRLQTRSGDPNEALLSQVRLMLQERLRQVEQGIQDPVQFREMFRQRSSTGPGGSQTPGAGSGFGPGPFQPTQTPGGGKGYGPEPFNPSETPIAGGGYGPGPLNPSETPMQGGGYGPGPNPTQTPGSGDGYGPGPLNPSETPGSGDGYSPGPYQPTATQRSAGPGEPQPTPPGGGGGGEGGGGDGGGNKP